MSDSVSIVMAEFVSVSVVVPVSMNICCKCRNGGVRNLLQVVVCKYHIKGNRSRNLTSNFRLYIIKGWNIPWSSLVSSANVKMKSPIRNRCTQTRTHARSTHARTHTHTQNSPRHTRNHINRYSFVPLSSSLTSSVSSAKSKKPVKFL